MTEAETSETPLELFSDRMYRMFSRYVRRSFSRRFSGVRLLNRQNAEVAADRRLVIYINHGSWWDAIIVHLVTSQLFGDRRPFAPMDAKALQHYRFFRKLGMFGVDLASRRGAIVFLRTAREVLAQHGTCLWLSPQGEFADPRRRPLAFQPGLSHLARDEDAVLLPLAIEYPFWDESKPEALLNFGSPVDPRELEARPVESWNTLLEDRLCVAMDELAEAALSRDAERFETLVAGSAGVNPIYDAWQYGKALIGGRRYTGRHRDISS